MCAYRRYGCLPSNPSVSRTDWPPDGKEIALYSRVQDKSQIFVIGADATGLRQITSGEANHFFPMWSKDGRWIYFSSNTPLAGGEEVQVIPSVHLHNFDIVSDGIYFLATASTLKFLNTAGQITTVAPQLPQGYVGLSVSPDKKSILFTADKPQTSELVLVENFQ